MGTEPLQKGYVFNFDNYAPNWGPRRNQGRYGLSFDTLKMMVRYRTLSDFERKPHNLASNFGREELWGSPIRRCCHEQIQTGQ